MEEKKGESRLIYSTVNNMTEYLYIIPAALIAIVLHEMAHGYVSYWLGDPTPKAQGRLSINPLKHIDPMGILFLILFRVGWAKPVMVNPRYYKNEKWGTALVSLAGPLMNFIIAFVSIFFYVLIVKNVTYTEFLNYLVTFLFYLAILNIGLGVFNLIPLPPLDGSKIIGAILPEQAYYQYMKYQKYGMIFLLILIVVMNILTMYNVPSLLNELIEWFFENIYSFWWNIL